MKKNTRKTGSWLIMLTLILFVSCSEQKVPTICSLRNPSPLTELGTREIKKYIYQRTGLIPTIHTESDLSDCSANSIIIVNIEDMPNVPQAIQERSANIGKEDFRIFSQDNRLFIIGGSDVATLYGAYRYAELLGVRFYLHGDVIPDEPYTGSLTHFKEELNSPLFSTRGILPFHDFPEGPDWWNEDDYKAYFSQLTKLRMNFFGLHTYPEGGPHAEPSVWIGLKKDIQDSAKVAKSYPATFANTQRPGHWGYAPLTTSQFSSGASLLYDREVYGADILKGTEPFPTTPDSMCLLFERTGKLLSSAFDFGHQFGLKFCMGTETPLTIPQMVRSELKRQGINPESEDATRMLYEGIFNRITQTHSLDYYWLWTPESWTWGNPTNKVVQQTINDIKIANSVLADMNYPFELALSGWVLGPPQNRSGFDQIIPARSPISCISRMWGQDRIERGFYKIKADRPKWAIPWLEEDPRMTIPQFWVGRMRADAAEALDYNCNGLIGIHWRTRSIAPNVRALAEASWSQKDWNPNFGKPYIETPVQTEDVRIQGKVNADDGRIIKGTKDSPVFNSLCYDMESYLVKVPNGVYTVTLQFCENVYNQQGKRVFGVNVEGEAVATHLDVFAKVGKDTAYEIKTKPIAVKDGVLNIDFNVEVENPFISGIIIEGKTEDVNQVKGEYFKRAINAGGIAYKDYEADLPEGTGMESSQPRDMEAFSFYKDYATGEFGKEIADSAAAIFVSVDGFYGNGGNDNVKIPRPANWVSNSGPGAVMPNQAPWDKEKQKYAFVDHFARLGSKVNGKGNIDRFNYWVNTFNYTKAMAKLGCTRGLLDQAMEKAGNMTNAKQRKQFVQKEILPIRIQMSREWEEMMGYLLQTVYTPGELGTVANLEQLSRAGNHFLDKHDDMIQRYTGAALPKEAGLSTQYKGPTRIILLTERSLIEKDEKMILKTIILSSGKTSIPVLKYRQIGERDFRSAEMELIARNTYSLTMPSVSLNGLEYYVTVEEAGNSINYPASAPTINNVIMAF